MYEYLKGTIAAVTPGFIVVDVQGVGYKVLVTNPFAYTVGQTATVFVQQIIRDNDQALYGFADEEEKGAFNQLLTVTGIGPKSALAILANANTQGLAQAVANGDVKFLTKFPGIGKKTAQQIILDLKGKLSLSANTPQQQALDLPENPALGDALAALAALGYSQHDIDAIKPDLTKAKATTTDAYLRTGLKLLTK